jgi:hypothetical protein
MKNLLLALFAAGACLPCAAQGSRLSLTAGAAYAMPVNASYIDTYQNEDIYWNPNAGVAACTALRIRVNDLVTIALPLEVLCGWTRYTTTDGRKVNTEAAAGTNPTTTNTEWSIAPSLGAEVLVRLGRRPASPYIGIGACLGLLWSGESWEYVNVDGQDTRLTMIKDYWPTPILRGELGWDVPLRNRWALNMALTFSMANFVMKRVTLTHYTIDGKDHIDEYDERSRVYTYAYDAPDENKGGDCLLEGFTYQNYPQEKISSNAALRISAVYRLR